MTKAPRHLKPVRALAAPQRPNQGPSEDYALVAFAPQVKPPTLSLVMGMPPPILSPNSRPHWAKKARATKAMRLEAFITARQAVARWDDLPYWTNAIVQLEAQIRRGKPQDPDNLLASCKAVFDGLVDAGLFTTDRTLVHLPPVQVQEKGHGLVVRIWA